jgi:putative PIN family toxin of toxin-antitoxin system
MRVVLDTNVLVSALLTPGGSCDRVLAEVILGNLTPCYDGRILAEYAAVLYRDRLKLPAHRVKTVLDFIRAEGEATVAPTLAALEPDPDDTKFWEVATHLEALLITGNTRHYPNHPRIITPAQILNPTR